MTVTAPSETTAAPASEATSSRSCRRPDPPRTPAASPRTSSTPWPSRSTSATPPSSPGRSPPSSSSPRPTSTRGASPTALTTSTLADHTAVCGHPPARTAPLVVELTGPDGPIGSVCWWPRPTQHRADLRWPLATLIADELSLAAHRLQQRQAAHTDPLTGVWNRRGLHRRVDSLAGTAYAVALAPGWGRHRTPRRRALVPGEPAKPSVRARGHGAVAARCRHRTSCTTAACRCTRSPRGPGSTTARWSTRSGPISGGGRCRRGRGATSGRAPRARRVRSGRCRWGRPHGHPRVRSSRRPSGARAAPSTRGWRSPPRT
jgi:hypothetical protein